jgi:hypothetical protein
LSGIGLAIQQGRAHRAAPFGIRRRCLRARDLQSGKLDRGLPDTMSWRYLAIDHIDSVFEKRRSNTKEPKKRVHRPKSMNIFEWCHDSASPQCVTGQPTSQ